MIIRDSEQQGYEIVKKNAMRNSKKNTTQNSSKNILRNMKKNTIRKSKQQGFSIRNSK